MPSQHTPAVHTPNKHPLEMLPGEWDYPQPSDPPADTDLPWAGRFVAKLPNGLIFTILPLAQGDPGQGFRIQNLDKPDKITLTPVFEIINGSQMWRGVLTAGNWIEMPKG